MKISGRSGFEKKFYWSVYYGQHYKSGAIFSEGVIFIVLNAGVEVMANCKVLSTQPPHKYINCVTFTGKIKRDGGNDEKFIKLEQK